MSTFLVDQPCYDLALRAGAIVFRDVRIEPSPAELRSLIDLEAEKVRERFNRPAEIRATSEIAGHYDVLRKVGVKPKSQPPSTQKLLEFALKRGTLPSVNNLVDAYNLVSIRSMCSLGAHDLARFTAPATLRLFQGDEPFRPLGSEENRAVTPGEFGYVDAENRVLCRLDSLQADFSKVTAETSSALLIVEATTAHSPEQIGTAFEAVQELVTKYCGGTAEVVARTTKGV